MDFERTQFDIPMEKYSEGQKKKVLIAKSLSQSAHLYLWDEPLNFIDVLSRIQIEDLILSYQPTMIFVEHDQAFVEKIATKILRLWGYKMICFKKGKALFIYIQMKQAYTKM